MKLTKEEEQAINEHATRAMASDHHVLTIAAAILLPYTGRDVSGWDVSVAVRKAKDLLERAGDVAWK